MLFRALTVFALLSGGFAGLVAGHTASTDPTTCGGGEDYTQDVTAFQNAQVGPGTALYVVRGSQAELTSADNYLDENRVRPLSIWVETNNRVSLQVTAYECKFADGHVYGVDSPGGDPDRARVAPDTRLAPPFP